MALARAERVLPGARPDQPTPRYLWSGGRTTSSWIRTSHAVPTSFAVRRALRTERDFEYFRLRCTMTGRHRDDPHGKRRCGRRRPAPVQRRHALRLHEQARRPPATATTAREGTYFAVWAPERRARSRWSATSTAGTDGRHPLQPRGQLRHLGGLRARGRQGRALQVPHRVARRRLPRGQGRPVRRSHARRRRRPRRSSGTWTTTGATATGWRSAARAQRAATRRCRSTRCTSVPGGASRGGQPLAELPRAGAAAGRLRAARWASPTSSSCR